MSIAKSISEKKLLGINGRMEWGPRALGNRSIIADARHKDIKDVINLKIKRKIFQTFCPINGKEFTKEWFKMDEEFFHVASISN